MKVIIGSLGALFVALSFSSCAETTGDPRQGGLFGWNRDQAEGRLSDKRYEADSIYYDTERVNAENRRLQQTRNNLR